MLTLTIPGGETYNEQTNEFTTHESVTLQLEHSLVSISKWESKWCKPFLSQGPKSYAETIDYVKCMTISQSVKAEAYDRITSDILESIKTYIEAPMTATTFNSGKGRGGSKEIVTSELIYYWMITFQIPFECQRWHLNRLLTLINICNIKNQPSKKMSAGELARRNRELNAQRRAKLNTPG